MYNTKLECAKYLKNKYGRRLEVLLKEKKAGKGYNTDSLQIIKEEYEIFFNNMNTHLEKSSTKEEVLVTIKEYNTFLDFIYIHGSDILKLYIDLFINNEEYNKILTRLNKKLPGYIVKYIKEYLKDN